MRPQTKIRQDGEAAAIIFDGPNKAMKPAILPLPSVLAPGEAIVEIELATICGSDLHIIAGHREQKTPAILGHEAVGRVVESARKNLSPGDRVSWSIAASCGECSFCRRYDLPQKCASLFKYGHSAMVGDARDLSGCYATHIVLRRGTHTAKIPDDMPAAVAAPANCALATMTHAISLLPRKCKTVVIQGAGMLGIYGCALLSERGCRVFCSDIDESRLAMVEKFGGIPLLSESESGRKAVLSAAADGADACIETAGSATVIAEGISLLRRGGFYLLVGALVRESNLDMLTAEQVIRGCLTLRGVHNYAPRHLDAAIAFLSRCGDKYPFADLVSAPFPLSEISSAIDASFARRWHRVAISP